MEERTRVPAGSKAQRGGEQTRTTRRWPRSTETRPHARHARGRTVDVATVVVTKAARPTTRTRHPARPLRGQVEVEPPSATGETARRRGGGDEEKRVPPGQRNQQQRGSIVPPHGGRQMSWYSHGGVQDNICHKVASCEGKTAAGISRDGYAGITR